MSKIITPVANSSSFEDWVAATNTLINVASKTVTLESNTAGDTSTGNGYVNGVFGAANLVAGTSLRGGTVDIPAALTITSNVNFSATINATANVKVVASKITLSGNSISDVITITSNATSSDLIIGGNNATINANISANGNLKLPSGNTSQRPTGSEALFRYNTDTTSVEYYDGNNWISAAKAPLVANGVVFTSTNTIASNTVQGAIVELSQRAVSVSGNNTLNGTLVLNISGATLPTDIPVSAIRVIQADGSVSRVLSDATGASAAYSGRRASGTSSSLTSLVANDQIFTVDAYGYNGSAFTTVAAGAILFSAAETWSTANNGTFMSFITTPVGSNASVTSLVLYSNLFSVNTGYISLLGNTTANNFTVSGNTTLSNVTINGNVIANNISVDGSLTVNNAIVWNSKNDGSGSGLDADLLGGVPSSSYAKLVSPSLTGTPTAPTATSGANTAQIATTAYVQGEFSSKYTASDVLTKIKTVDGSGSGLDADTLDGNDSTAFATAAQGTKADNALPASSYTASDVLTKIKTVDGSGTGLDADTVDGLHATSFATATQGTKADNALPASSYTASDVLTKIKTVDGSGSGLDADTLDGHDSTYFYSAGNPPVTNKSYGQNQTWQVVSRANNTVYYNSTNQPIGIYMDLRAAGPGTTTSMSSSVYISQDGSTYFLLGGCSSTSSGAGSIAPNTNSTVAIIPTSSYYKLIYSGFDGSGGGGGAVTLTAYELR